MRLDHLLSKGTSRDCFIVQRSMPHKNKRCRCVCGTHPFPFRTRWLRHRRPMVLYWRRYGRAGGCRFIKTIPRKRFSYRTHGGIAQLGERLPCKQEVTSSNLVISTKIFLKARTGLRTADKLAYRRCADASDGFAKYP